MEQTLSSDASGEKAAATARGSRGRASRAAGTGAGRDTVVSAWDLAAGRGGGAGRGPPGFF